MYAAFVADESKIDEVRARVDEALVSAIRQGYFGTASRGTQPVVIGSSRLSPNVPATNVARGDQEDDGSVACPELAAASKTARELGFAIKVKGLTVDTSLRRTNSRLLALSSPSLRFDGGACYNDEFAHSSHLSARSSLYAPGSVLSRPC